MKEPRRWSQLEALKPINLKGPIQTQLASDRGDTSTKANQYFGVGSNQHSRTRIAQWAMEAIKNGPQVPGSVQCHSQYELHSEDGAIDDSKMMSSSDCVC